LPAAGIAIPFETPKLIATAVMNEGSFADLLERRLQNLQAINEGKLIEQQPQPPIEAKPFLSRVADRRWRKL
jgi:hypothetical protein